MILDDNIAPQGYGYLLVMNGHGTVKSCLFSGFKQERMYVERTVERFRRLVGFELQNPRFHGGIGNFRIPATALSGGHPIAGEQAGFQDAFAGFGMRYAIRSGVMSARTLLGEGNHDTAWRGALQPAIETSIVNRAVFSPLGNRGYRYLLRSQASSRDARAFLGRRYGADSARRLLLPWARMLSVGVATKRLDFLLLAGANFAIALGYGAILPILPMIHRGFGDVGTPESVGCSAHRTQVRDAVAAERSVCAFSCGA